MYRCRFWVSLGLVAMLAGLAQAVVVYKWTDADGVVHFSDQPVPGAEKITTSGSSRIGFGPPTAATSAAAAAALKPKGPATPTPEIAITSPGKDETITGDQPVSVHLSVQPELKPQQTITWTLNGSALSQAPDATQFTLEDLARGTYTLSATLNDPISGETRSAESVTFYVVRNSVLQPGHKGGR
jgi:hypothetical protein